MQFSIEGQALAQWRREAIQQAIAGGIDPNEVDWFLQYSTALDKLTLRLDSLADWAAIPSRYPFPELQQRWQRRLRERCPLQYLVEVAPWRQFHLRVSPAVLIPRPETELLIDWVASQIKSQPHLQTGNWVDLGTGSGAIALGLAALLPDAQIHAVDYSEEALAIARQNAQTYGLQNQIHFYQGCWWEPLDYLRGQVQGMIANPPYIPSAELPHLQPEVYGHEPLLALDGGEDGLTAIRHLINTAPDYLQASGLWAIEMMQGQGAQIKTLLSQQGHYQKIQGVNDLGGIERFVTAQVH
ncbi:MAG: peptide chain release factor N(5)-glutamine methyltransferase [Merismopediaceae bacterium]|nr:peptide chain release factor N(5)-glutamine methyltransferase [Merismopediaceae bacterium]